jgi:hypothetical protein
MLARGDAMATAVEAVDLQWQAELMTGAFYSMWQHVVNAARAWREAR